MNTPRVVAALALCALTVPLNAFAQPAPAQPAPAQPTATPTEAPMTPAALEAEHARGLELRRLHRDGEARDVFRAVYERTHEPRARARQAAAEAAVGEWVAAEEHLTEALRDQQNAWIIQNRAGLESDATAFRQQVGLLDVVTSTPGAEVWIGGRRMAALPLTEPLHVRAGSVNLELRAPGFVTELRTVNATGGMRAPTRESIDLMAVPVAAPAPAVPVAPAVVAVTPPAPRAEEGSWLAPLHIAGVALAGAGAIGVALGIAGLVIEGNKLSEYDADASCATTMPADACATRLDDASTMHTMGIVGLAAGGALLAGGIVMMIIPQSTRSPRTASIVGGPGNVGLSLRLAF